ncbi:MAG: single-stranded DNA-binding protein [Chlamydiota bacterium]
MNFIQIAGHLGADAETRYTPSGQKVTSLRIASNVRRSGKDETMWWRVTIWGDRFDKMLPYLKKGTPLIVAGTMQPPTIFQTRDGNNQIALEMTAEMINFSPFGSGRNSGKGDSNEGFSSNQQFDGGNYSTQNAPAPERSAPAPQEPFNGDDLPF